MLTDRELYFFYSIMVMIAIIVIPVCVKVAVNHFQLSYGLTEADKVKKSRLKFLSTMEEGVYVLHGRLFIISLCTSCTDHDRSIVISTLKGSRSLVTWNYQHASDTLEPGIFRKVTLSGLMNGPLYKVEGVTGQQLHRFKNSLAWERIDRHKFMYATTPAHVKHQLMLAKIIHHPEGQVA